MRNDKMIGVTAAALDADHSRGHTKVIQSFAAARARAATRPRIHETVFSDGRIGGVRSGCDDRSVRLVAERRGQAHSALGHQQTLAAAQLEVTLPDVHVAVTHSAVFEPQQYLRTLWLGNLALRFLKRFAPFDDVVAQHLVSRSRQKSHYSSANGEHLINLSHL